MSYSGYSSSSYRSRSSGSRSGRGTAALITSLSYVVIQAIVLVINLTSHGGGPAAGAMCFKQPTTAQVAQLQQYVAQHPGSKIATKDSKDVCVLVPNGHGGYVAQYYNGPTTVFPYYPYYVAMTNTANSSAKYGQNNGSVSTVERVTLDNLTEIGPDGKITQPYTLEKTGYVRTNTLVKTAKVSAVRYGLDNEVSPSKAFTNPSKGFTVDDVPVSTNNAASTGSDGSFHVSPLKSGQGGYNAPVDDDPVHGTGGDDGGDSHPIHFSGGDE